MLHFLCPLNELTFRPFQTTCVCVVCKVRVGDFDGRKEQATASEAKSPNHHEGVEMSSPGTVEQATGTIKDSLQQTERHQR